MTDQSGTAHGYNYDKLARLTADAVTFPAGTALDTAVGILQAGYNERGLPVRFTSLAPDGATVVNEVTRGYNSFNQLATEWQEHSGAVTTGTPKVAYSHADGSANTIRPTGIASPGGTEIVTAYTGETADAISRPDEIRENSAVLASYRFLGLGVVVGLKYDAAAGAELTMENGGAADAGDAYTGLDRFNRLVETIWQTSSEKLVHSSYGRNRASGIVWRRDELAHAMTPAVTTQDNSYEYDGLQQVTRHDRGDLMPASGPPFTGIDPATRQQREDFAFDETGNWTQYRSATPTTAWTQDRVNNTSNQIDSLTGPAGVIQPVYDKAGNMTTMPKAGDWTTANVLTWDAWNRPVKLTEGADETGYAYDALTRRTTKTTATETRNYYYNNQWRAIEERVSDAVKAAYVWSPIDRWTMIRRKRSVTGTLDETRYALKDYLDPVAIIDTDANVVERYGYEAFGPVRIMAPDFATLTTSACAWNFLFHAEFLDLDSGLYNYGYRYFHPELGRWPSRDPIGERGGLNLYEFVGNRPVDAIDLFGLKDQEVNKCRSYLFIGHGDKSDPLSFKVASGCSRAGAVLCFPKTNNLPVGNPTRWPNIPTHDDQLGSGSAGEKIANTQTTLQNLDEDPALGGSATGLDDPAGVHNFRVAVKNAMDSIPEVRKQLCKCCTYYRIVVEIQSDATFKDDIAAAIAPFSLGGKKLSNGINYEQGPCP